MWSQLVSLETFEEADQTGRAHQLAETAMRAIAAQNQQEAALTEANVQALLAGYQETRHQPAAQLPTPPEKQSQNSSAFNLVALDRFGSAAACTVTLNNPFGVGQIAEGTGVVIAAADGGTGRGTLPLTPMVFVNENTHEVYYAASATGGALAPTALMAVTASTVLGGSDLEGALNGLRVHHNGDPDTLFHNGALSESEETALEAMGHQVENIGSMGRVAGFYCADGAEVKPETCEIRVDPNSYGLAVGAE